jgi:2',3'-cyclic-nucleotide 2'-phosphodiesterase (5'-nucleotidase family)
MFFAVGDMIQGDNWANLFEGKSVIELMNAIEFDAALIDLNKENLREK